VLFRSGLTSLRARGVWDDELAAAEAICRLRMADAPGAVVAYDEAIHLKDKELSYAFERGLVLAREGWGRALDPLVEELEAGKDDWMALALDAWREVETGGARADELLAIGVAKGESEGRPLLVQMSILSCRSWLDLGDPVAADHAARRGVKVSMSQTRLLACRAEALRRQGWLDEAGELVSRPWNELAETPYLDAVEVRVLVDRGRLAEAREVAARLPDTDDPEILASRWYLARALRSPEAARWAARYEGVPRPEGRTLERYVPVGAVGGP